MMEGKLIHWCAIETGEETTGTADAAGMYTTLVTTASTRCLFRNEKAGKVLESGEFVQDVPRVILPATTSIVEGATLTGVSSGWARNYVVRAVKTIYNRVGIDHVACDLEAA